MKKEKKSSAGKYLKLAQKLIWAEPDKGREIIDEMLRETEAALAELIPLLNENNDENATAANFAIEGVIMSALSPDCCFEDFDAVQTALITGLNNAVDAYSRTQIIRYLGLLGGSDCVDSLAEWLAEDEYFSVTLLALRHIGSEDAYELICRQLDEATGSNFAALALAVTDQAWLLGPVDCFNEEKFQQELSAACDDDLTAFWKAAAASDMSFVDDMLLEACGHERKSLAGAAFAIVSDRVSSILGLEEGITLAEKLYNKFPSAFTLNTWYLADYDEIRVNFFEAVFKALGSEDYLLREAAIELLAKIVDCSTEIEELIELAYLDLDIGSQAMAALIKALGKKKDKIARPFIMSMLWHEELIVRKAAMEAIEELEGELNTQTLKTIAMYK